jgi:serine protease Do
MYVTAVETPGPSEQQLLESGDILISLNGIALTTQNQLDAMINSCKVGDTLEAVVYRDGKQLTLTLTVLEHKG